MPTLLSGNANYSNIVFVDYINNFAGINTNTPNQSLTVIGNTYISHNLFINDRAGFGTSNLNETINVSGNINVNQLIKLNGVQFNTLTSNPGDPYTLWVNSSGFLYLGNTLINFTGPTG